MFVIPIFKCCILYLVSIETRLLGLNAVLMSLTSKKLVLVYYTKTPWFDFKFLNSLKLNKYFCVIKPTRFNESELFLEIDMDTSLNLTFYNSCCNFFVVIVSKCEMFD